MSATTTSASLEDVEDVEAFVASIVHKTFRKNGDRTEDEITEAIREGVVLTYEIHGDWNAEATPSFRLFLSHRLPRRLISWFRVDLRQSGRGSWSGRTGSYRYHGMVSLNDDGLGLAGEAGDSALTTYIPGAE